MRLNEITPEIMEQALEKSHNYKTLAINLGVSSQYRNHKWFETYLRDHNVKIPDHFSSGRFSKLNNISMDDLQYYFDNSNSLSDVLRKCGFRVSGGNLKTLMKIVTDNKISQEILNTNREKQRTVNLLNGPCIFSLKYDELKNKYSFTSIKRYIKHHQLIEYVCARCGNKGEYNNEPLILELDHINGNHIDNELSNLRFLCPNCHSQTETHSRRYKTRPENNKCQCGAIIHKNSNKCTKCASLENSNSRRKFEATKEELEKLIKEKPMTVIGKMFGVSDNAIRKRCKRYGIL